MDGISWNISYCDKLCLRTIKDFQKLYAFAKLSSVEYDHPFS